MAYTVQSTARMVETIVLVVALVITKVTCLIHHTIAINNKWRQHHTSQTMRHTFYSSPRVNERSHMAAASDTMSSHVYSLQEIVEVIQSLSNLPYWYPSAKWLGQFQPVTYGSKCRVINYVITITISETEIKTASIINWQIATVVTGMSILR